MAGSIGDLDIVINADASDVPNQVKKQTEKPLGKVGDNLAKSLSTGLTSGLKKLGSGVAKTFNDTLVSASKLTGAAIAGVLGTALVKGFGRLKAIDNAEASLRALAATADHVPEVMDAARNSVLGTAFGLDQAASAAAQFANARIPIEDLERHLSSLANSAAAAGGDFDGMSDIFAKVAARGNVTGEVLNQLTSRGISGLSALADYYGISAEEVQKMVSRSEVSFDDFSRAMDAAMGKAALEQATTFTGLMMNVGAALGRIGAEAQRPLFNALKASLPGVIDLLKQVEAAVVPVATAIGNVLAPAAERLSARLSAINFSVSETGAKRFLSALGPLLPVIGGVVGAMGGMLSSLPVIGGLFSALSGPVGVLAGALVALLALKPEQLLTGFENILSALPGLVSRIVTTVTTVVPEIVARLAENLPILVNGFVSLITALVPAATGVIPSVVSAIVKLIPMIISAIVNALPSLVTAALELFMGLVTGLLKAIPELLKELLGMLPQLVSTVLGMIPELLDAAVELFTSLIDSLPIILPRLLAMIIGLFPQVITTVIGLIPKLLTAAIQLFTALITALPEILPNLLFEIIDMAPEIVQAIISMIPALIDAGVQLFTALIMAIPQIHGKLKEQIDSLWPRMQQAIAGIIPRMLNAGRDLISGLVQGIRNAAASVGRVLLDIAKNAVNSFLSFLGIHSPSRLFADFGMDTMRGYVEGLQAMAGAVDDAMRDVLPPDVRGEVSVRGTSLEPGSGYRGSTSTSNDNSRTTVFEEGAFQVSGADPRRVAVEIMDAAAEESER